VCKDLSVILVIERQQHIVFRTDILLNVCLAGFIGPKDANQIMTNHGIQLINHSEEVHQLVVG
jgi:hypothetical protein